MGTGNKKNIKLYRSKDGDFFVNANLLETPVSELNPLHLKIYSMTKNVDKILNIILDKLLIYLDIMMIRDSLYTVLNEIITNSIKANLKRIFFKNKNANINDIDNYDDIMKNFKSEILSEKVNYTKLLKENDFFVLITMTYTKERLIITIRNNSKITAIELDRIKKRIEKAKQCNNLIEVFDEHADDTEGAGLGLAMSLLMLKNEGISPENAYEITSYASDTVVKINIPFKFQKYNPHLKETQEIIKNIESLPMFPDTIEKIQELILDPTSTIDEIAEHVKRDVSLSANLLKLANSVAFAQQTRVDTVERAIHLIGLKELNSILYTLGTKRIMEERYSAFEEVWERSNECAFICKKLAERKKFKRKFITNLLSTALLYDTGEVVILSLEREILEKLAQIARRRKIPSTVLLEEYSLGISHTQIGSIICEKWNFPEIYKIVMIFHHRPLMAEQKYHPFLFPIYLSDMIINITNGKSQFSQIHSEVLEYFNLDNEKDFNTFIKSIKKEYVITVSEKVRE